MAEEVIFGLAERTKHQIYDDFHRMKRQSAIILTSSKSERKYAIKWFRRKFYNFYIDIYTQSKYKTLPKEWRDVLDNFFNDVNTIKTDNDVEQITAISGEIMKVLNLTNISFTKNDFAV